MCESLLLSGPAVLNTPELLLTFVSLFQKIKNNHLNQAIHEEREAIIELRVQLRLLQRAKSEQQGQEEEEPEKRGGVSQQQRDTVLETKAAKEQPKASKEQQVKPSPSKDRKETPI